MHENRLHRHKQHGSCSLLPAAVTQADALWTDHGFGLGYLDQQGDLSHHLWASAKGEHGPYRVSWLSYRTGDELLELLSLLGSLGDQVHCVRLREPAGIQLQDLLRHPFRQQRVTQHSPMETRITAVAEWQFRILDLDRCLQATHLEGRGLRFNLALTDPIGSLLEAASPWKGTAGDFIVTLGPESCAQPGVDPSLPSMQASVNAFSRLWLGVRSATSLSWSDDLHAPRQLLDDLDTLLCLPVPQPDWDF